jgi:transcriptional regulator with XRE-family HTH domain
MSDMLSNLLVRFPRPEVAAALGASERTVRRWAAGTNTPTGSHLARILSFLNRPEHLKKLGRRKPLTLEEIFAPAGKGRAA